MTSHKLPPPSGGSPSFSPARPFPCGKGTGDRSLKIAFAQRIPFIKAVRRANVLLYLRKCPPRQVPLPSRGVVAPFTNVNGRVWGGTPSLSLRERGTGGVEEKGTEKHQRNTFNVCHKVKAFSEV